MDLYALEDVSVLQERIAESDLLVNATSVGMDGQSSPVPESISLPENLLVADIIYQPFETPFLKWARRQGNPAVNGLGMLLYQAAEAFQLWTGKEMPTEEIWQSLTEKIPIKKGRFSYEIRIDISHHPYDIQIEKGCLAQAGQWLRELWQPQKVVIVTDNHVASLYAEKVKLSLEDAGFPVAVFDFLEGEERKNLTTVQKVYEFLVKQGLTRSDGIVALGGGVVGDLAGFVASTYMRGIHFVQIPTSLTAQVDSSIGGKTGVNTPFAKNMVGTFAQPDGVLIDPLVLETLGKRELIEGMGEVIKYGLIEDPELWALLTELDGSVESILEYAETLIEHSCQVKRKMVVEDELDNGVRLYLNLATPLAMPLKQRPVMAKSCMVRLWPWA